MTGRHSLRLILVAALAVASTQAARASLRRRGLGKDQMQLEAMTRIMKADLEACSEHTTCDACTKAKACGWCVDDGKCYGGGAAGPVDIEGNATRVNKDVCQVWAFAQCKLSSCEARTSCQSCVSDIFCGWCASSGECFEGNDRGPLSTYCVRGWLRSPVSQDTRSEMMVQQRMSEGEVHGAINQMCINNDILVGRSVQQMVGEERRMNMTLKAHIERCDPCAGAWPHCDCGGNEQLEGPRPLGEEYIIRDGDEAVGVRSADVNVTFIREMERKRREALTPDQRVEEVVDKLAEEKERTASMLSMLPPKPSDAAVEKREQAARELLGMEALQNVVINQNLTSLAAAQLVSDVAKHANASQARLEGQVLGAVAESLRALGGDNATVPTPQEAKQMMGGLAERKEDDGGYSSLMADLEHEQRNLEVEAATEVAEQKLDELRKEVEEEDEKAKEQETKVLKERAEMGDVPREDVEKLARIEEERAKQEEQLIKGEATERVAALKEGENEAVDAAESINKATFVFQNARAEAVTQMEQALEQVNATYTEIHQLQLQEQQARAEVQRLEHVLSEISNVGGTGTATDSGMDSIIRGIIPAESMEAEQPKAASCTQRLLLIMADAREDTKDTLENLLHDLERDDMNGEEKQRAMQTHMEDLQRSEDIAAGKVDTVPADVAASLEGCVIMPTGEQ